MQDRLDESSDISDSGLSKRIVGSKARVGPRDVAKAQPTINVKKLDGRVQSIVVTCRCGEEITVVCEYAE